MTAIPTAAPAAPDPTAGFRMPADLPYPQTPPYTPGQYGPWRLHTKFEETRELGYFTGLDVEPVGHYLVKDGWTWMSTSRLELESHAVHLKHARGTVVVCGVGMAMFLYNVACSPRVDRVIAVDLDRSVMDLAQHATGFDDWPGRRKVSFVHRDATTLTPEDVGGPVDFLYVDIWPELGDPAAIPQTQAIQAAVKATTVGWWGQEVDFVQWCFEHRPAGHVPTVDDYVAFGQAVGLPIAEATEAFVRACRQAGEVFKRYGSHPFAVAGR
ncbi:MAG TPA: hypothetical protein VF796_29415 [Humisphaera sp.]